MATTKIWPIKSGHLGKVIDYVSNSMKTDEHNFSAREIENLYNAIHYVEDTNKTMNQEKHIHSDPVFIRTSIKAVTASPTIPKRISKR